MEEDLFEHIDTMFESVQKEVTNSDLTFKTHKARQSLVAIEEQYTAGQEAFEKADIND